MFDQSLALNKSNEKRREMVAFALQAAIEAGTFTYTDCLSAKEPMRTDALEQLDGVKVNDGRPQPNQGIVQNWDGKKLLLVHVSPAGRIRGKVVERERVPGADKVRDVARVKDYGNFAWISDHNPDRHARMILHRDGWPVVQTTSEYTRTGTVVEWRWLEREAKSATPFAGVRELYEEILGRPGFRKAAGLPEADDAPIKAQQMNQKLGAAKEQRPGA